MNTYAILSRKTPAIGKAISGKLIEKDGNNLSLQSWHTSIVREIKLIAKISQKTIYEVKNKNSVYAVIVL